MFSVVAHSFRLLFLLAPLALTLSPAMLGLLWEELTLNDGFREKSSVLLRLTTCEMLLAPPFLADNQKGFQGEPAGSFEQ